VGMSEEKRNESHKNKTEEHGNLRYLNNNNNNNNNKMR
jgi:hypothetical protein